jgi:hypothetical protein
MQGQDRNFSEEFETMIRVDNDREWDSTSWHEDFWWIPDDADIMKSRIKSAVEDVDCFGFGADEAVTFNQKIKIYQLSDEPWPTGECHYQVDIYFSWEIED